MFYRTSALWGRCPKREKEKKNRKKEGEGERKEREKERKIGTNRKVDRLSERSTDRQADKLEGETTIQRREI